MSGGAITQEALVALERSLILQACEYGYKAAQAGLDLPATLLGVAEAHDTIFTPTGDA